MNRFNHYMNSHFSGCRLLARAHDDCRNRRVTIHQVPGHWDVVGVSDGTDSWIAPVTAGAFFRTATGDVADIMRRLQAGEEVGAVPDAPKRSRIALVDEEEPQPRPRRRILEEAAQQPAKKVRHALA